MRVKFDVNQPSSWEQNIQYLASRYFCRKDPTQCSRSLECPFCSSGEICEAKAIEMATEYFVGELFCEPKVHIEMRHVHTILEKFPALKMSCCVVNALIEKNETGILEYLYFSDNLMESAKLLYEHYVLGRFGGR